MKRLIKLIIGTLVIVSTLELSPIAVHAEWRKSNTSWWYTEGNSYATGWRQIEGKWYYFDSNGYMVYNTLVGNYYINSDGIWIDDSNYNVTASKAQEIIKQYFINNGKHIPKCINIEGEKSDSWGVHCYDPVKYDDGVTSLGTVYGWFWVNKNTGKF